MPFALSNCVRRSRSVALTSLAVSTIAIVFARANPAGEDPAAGSRAVLQSAWLKWKEAVPFEKTSNWIPAAICLQNAIQLAAQAPRAQLTNNDLVFIAQLHSAYAAARYQVMSAQPSEQTWSAYLQAADNAKSAIDSAGHAVVNGQPAASLLMLRGQIELMNCNYNAAERASQFAGQLYPPGKKEYAQFGAFAEKSSKNGTGPCRSNQVSGSAQWKQYAEELYQAIEVIEKVQNAAKLIE